jgi:hypothetical protein
METFFKWNYLILQMVLFTSLINKITISLSHNIIIAFITYVITSSFHPFKTSVQTLAVVTQGSTTPACPELVELGLSGLLSVKCTSIRTPAVSKPSCWRIYMMVRGDGSLYCEDIESKVHLSLEQEHRLLLPPRGHALNEVSYHNRRCILPLWS